MWRGGGGRSISISYVMRSLRRHISHARRRVGRLPLVNCATRPSVGAATCLLPASNWCMAATGAVNDHQTSESVVRSHRVGYRPYPGRHVSGRRPRAAGSERVAPAEQRYAYIGRRARPTQPVGRPAGCSREMNTTVLQETPAVIKSVVNYH